jgi:hypothetical protein
METEGYAAGRAAKTLENIKRYRRSGATIMNGMKNSTG